MDYQKAMSAACQATMNVHFGLILHKHGRVSGIMPSLLLPLPFLPPRSIIRVIHPWMVLSMPPDLAWAVLNLVAFPTVDALLWLEGAHDTTVSN